MPYDVAHVDRTAIGTSPPVGSAPLLPADGDRPMLATSCTLRRVRESVIDCPHDGGLDYMSIMV